MKVENRQNDAKLSDNVQASQLKRSDYVE